jgi:hypothetical protein
MRGSSEVLAQVRRVAMLPVVRWRLMIVENACLTRSRSLSLARLSVMIEGTQSLTVMP